MHELVNHMPRTRTISTVGTMVTSANRPHAVYVSQVRSGLVPPGHYEVTDPTLGFLGIPNLLSAVVGKVGGLLGKLKGTSVTFPGGGQLNIGTGGDASYQPGGQPTAGQQIKQTLDDNKWIMPVAIGGVAILAVMMLSRRGRG